MLFMEMERFMEYKVGNLALDRALSIFQLRVCIKAVELLVVAMARC